MARPPQRLEVSDDGRVGVQHTRGDQHLHQRAEQGAVVYERAARRQVPWVDAKVRPHFEVAVPGAARRQQAVGNQGGTAIVSSAGTDGGMCGRKLYKHRVEKG